MKLSKNLGRIATTFLATAMLAGLTAVPASAAASIGANGTAGGGNGTPLDEKKLSFVSELWLPDGVSVPDATFTYTLTGADASGDPDYNVTNGSVDVQAGTGTLTESAEFDSTDDSKVTDSGETGIKKVTETVTFDLSKLPTFTNVGVYKYTLTQGLTSDLSSDFNTSKISSRVVYLFVGHPDTAPDTCEVTGAVMVNSSSYDAKAKSKGNIINFYLIDGNPDNPGDPDNPPEVKDNTLTISNAIAGAMGDKTAEFNFNFTVSSSADSTKQFAYVVTKDGAPGSKQYATSGTEVQSIKLGDGDTITIYGLSSSDKFTVSQTDADTNGYDTKIGDEDISGVTEKTLGDYKTLAFTNTRDSIAPTGLVMNVAPYVLLVLVAAGAGYVFLRKREED